MRTPSFMLPKQAAERFGAEGAARPAPRRPGPSADVQRAIRGLAAAGHGCQSLAALYGLPLDQVRALVLRPRPRLTPAAALEMRAAGLSVREIAERSGVSHSTVSAALRKARAARTQRGG